MEARVRVVIATVGAALRRDFLSACHARMGELIAGDIEYRGVKPLLQRENPERRVRDNAPSFGGCLQ